MSGKIANWLRKDIRLKLPSFKRTPPSPLTRKLGRLLQIIMLLVLCAFAIWRVQLYRELRGRFDRIRAAGLPVSGAELNQWCPSIPESENGALVLTQALALVYNFPDKRAVDIGSSALLSRTNVWAPATRAVVEEFVRTNASALAKAPEAFRFSRFRFPLDFSYGPDIALPHLSPLKQLARAAGLQGALEAESGLADQWPERVSFQLKLAGALDREPTLISHLVRSAIICMAAKTTERCLSHASPQAKACQQLQVEFHRIGQTNLLPLVLIGERATLIPVFRLSSAEMKGLSGGGESGNEARKPQRYSGKPMPLLWATGFLERDLYLYLETLEKSIALAALPLPDSLAMTNCLDQGIRAAQRKHCLLAELLLPSESRVIVREASTQALIRLTATALAVERFRQGQGRLPASLSELVPQFLEAIPADPFDGAPIRYHRLPKGYVIYSVDADGRDDGGREPPVPKKLADETPYDITFVVER